MFHGLERRISLLPLIYTNAVAAGIFLAACLIWNVPEMIGTIKQTAKTSRKKASVQDHGSKGILIGLQWAGITLNFLIAGLFRAAAITWHQTALFLLGDLDPPRCRLALVRHLDAGALLYPRCRGVR